jgi:hypothetical protein
MSFNYLAPASQRAAGAVAGDERIDASVHLPKNLPAGVFLVVLDVQWLFSPADP